MKNFRTLSFVSGLILLVLCLVSCSEPSDRREEGRNKSLPQIEGVEAPNFKLPDLEGRSFQLSQFRGNPVLLIFSTTWCAYCRSELPHLREINGRYSSKGLEVIQIFIQESPRKVASFSSQYRLPYRVLLDERGEVAEAYRVRGVPDLILLDRNGRVLCRRCPDLDASLKDLFEKPQQN
ncbi:Peroxiredoxin [Syntrophus gentianae]|uniref:Peroxiredoxin n=1 Tax=Syntrophus gentianae TaxID=43775 RepID=A0A1H7VRX4_9BACT|nr:TlpA disulfide reductase family protein [Syntrophus gentianae]SEM11547.1 Peroxiredoxin [Syntrophus gentianae]